MRPKSVSNRLARLVMGTVLTGTSPMSNITHHKHVATDADPHRHVGRRSGDRGRTYSQLVDVIGLHDAKG